MFIAAPLLLTLFPLFLFPPPVGAHTPPSDNADLSALSVAGFDADTLSYDFVVAAATTPVTVRGVVSDTNATVAYNPAGADAVAAGHQVDLVEGRNPVTVTVTAQDGGGDDGAPLTPAGRGYSCDPVIAPPRPCRLYVAN